MNARTAAAVISAGMLALIAFCLVVIMANVETMATNTAPTDSSAPDWTVAPCALWSATQTPELPPFTYTDRCAADDGSIVSVAR